MAANEILQFASTNTGTNLLTQAEYAADAQRTTGNQPGIARSKLVNKSLRQASLLAAGLAEFIADYQSNDVTDSLTPQNIADYLYASILAAFPSATETLQGKIELATAAEVQAGTDTTRAITPAGLQTMTGNESRDGLVQFATTAEVAALSAADRAISPLRLPSAFPYFRTGGGESGWYQLPNGFILQFCRYTLLQDNYSVQTLPITFPSVAIGIWINPTVGSAGGGINTAAYGARFLNNSQFEVWNDNVQQQVYAIALGW